MEKKGNDTFGRRAEETLHEVEKYGREKKHDIQEKARRVSRPRTREKVMEVENRTKSGMPRVVGEVQLAGEKIKNRVKEGATQAAHGVSEKADEATDRIKEKIR